MQHDRSDNPDPAAKSRDTDETLPPVTPPLEAASFSIGGAVDSASAWEYFLERLRSRGPAWSRYEIRGEIGRGGMGQVVEIFDQDVRRRLALKRLRTDRPHANEDPATLIRFVEEVQVTGQLDHPGIVPVHEVGVDDRGRVYFTMKLVRGEDLRAVFNRVNRKESGWSVPRALGVLLKVCDAMAYAHAKGVIHRDLKPANVMVGRYGEAYVMDWGLARILGEPDRVGSSTFAAGGDVESVATERSDLTYGLFDSPLVTSDGQVVGTPAYMPPEQARGDLSKLGPASDVYAVGAMLYHLIAGHAPYSRELEPPTPSARLRSVLGAAPRPIAEVARESPPELVAICEKAMAKDAAARYASMEDLAADLRAYLEDRVVKAHATGAVAELRKWVRRNRGVAATAIAGLVIAAAIGAAFFVHVRDQRADAVAERQRLADVIALDELRARLDSLWPALPSRIPDIERLLVDADALRARLPAHRSTLDALRATAVADGNSTAGGTAWWIATLDSLCAGIDSLAVDDPFGATLGAARRRLGLAGAVAQESAERHREAWSRVIDAVAAPGSPYRGLALAPQEGLVPLGPDPRSGLQEFWHVQSGSRPERDAAGRLRLAPESGIVLVLVPSAKLLIGTQIDDPSEPNYDPMQIANDHVLAEVDVAAFFLSKYEMTQSQWLRFVGSEPCAYSFETEEAAKHWGVTPINPVEMVTYSEVATVLARLDLRPPTANEWEHACRAGTTTPWWTGADPETIRAKANLASDPFDVHVAVDRLEPNPFGFHHILGNVWEWTSTEWLVSGRTYRETRGGAYLDEPANARCGSRNPRHSSTGADGDLGIRPARSVNVAAASGR